MAASLPNRDGRWAKGSMLRRDVKRLPVLQDGPTGDPPVRSLRVALVRGPIVFAEGALNNEATPPLGFAYIAGYLGAHGYSVEIVDGIGEALNQVYPLPDFPGYAAQGLSFEQLVARVPDDVDVIGFAVMFSGEWPVTRQIIRRARERFPDALFVAGGEHATALSEYSLRDCPELDVVVRGEGEHTLFELLEATRVGADRAAVAGVAWLDDDGAYRQTGDLPRIRSLAAMPRPAWPDGLLEKYWAAGKSHGVLTERDMPMLASRGCPYRCTFCSSPQMWTTRYVLRDPSDVLDEIEHYVAKYAITSVQFYDLTAIVKRDWIVKFCTEMMARGVKLFWSLPAGTRSEALDAETLRLVKASGCHYLVYAPESGSPATLQRIKKRISLERITGSMLAATGYGIVVRANIIIGLPGETRREIYETIAYVLSLTWRGVDEVAVFLFSPYPGSALYAELVANRTITPDDAYFLSLTSLNGKFNTLSPRTFNEHTWPAELAAYRTATMAAAYAIGYARHPSRVVRTLRNLLADSGAATVLEHRLRDALRRRRSAV